jgi:hypothetical protein
VLCRLQHFRAVPYERGCVERFSSHSDRHRYAIIWVLDDMVDGKSALVTVYAACCGFELVFGNLYAALLYGKISNSCSNRMHARDAGLISVQFLCKFVHVSFDSDVLTEHTTTSSR